MRKEPKLSRSEAMNARPERTPVLDAAPMDDGGLRVTVDREPGTIPRLLGDRKPRRRSYELDICGRDVYEACNGEASCAEIAHEFAAKHAIPRAEAERAVARYLRTLLEKGLIVMKVDAAAENASMEGTADA